jgi:uncharacterized protein involved in exopolysaccharide biosynthesis
MKKYYLVILGVFLTLTVGAWGTLQVFFTEQYETQASLLVKLGRENVEVPSSVQNGQLLSQGVRVADINSEVQMLSSRALIEAVVDKFGPDSFFLPLQKPVSVMGYPKYYLKRAGRWGKSVYQDFLIAVNLKKRLTRREEAILGVEQGLQVEPVKDSDVLILKLRLPSAKLAVDVASALLDQYMARRANIRRMSTGTGFFDTQLEENQKRLQDLVRARGSIRKQWNVSSSVEQRSLLLKQLSDISAESARTETEISRLLKQREVMEEEIKKGPELIRKEQVSAQNPSIQSIKDRITALRVERAKLASRYLPDSEVVKKIEKEIGELETALARESPTIVSAVTSEANPVVKDFTREIEQHSVNIAGLESRKEKLLEPTKKISSELARIDTGSDALERLDREYRLAEQNYMVYAKKREEARISDELDAKHITNVTLIAAPETPIEPIYPRKLFIMGIALPLGLLLGIVFAALLESMDDRIRSDRDLDGVGDIPFLGAVTV